MNSRIQLQTFLAATESKSLTTAMDWREEVLLAVESGDCGLAHNAWKHAGIMVTKDVMERLLLNALCLGRVVDAYQAAVMLERGFDEKEIMMLTEVAMLTGNISGICMIATNRRNSTHKAYQDCAMIIAVARHMRLKNKQNLPPYGVTGSWQNVYAKEIKQLGIKGDRFYTSHFPSGNFLHVNEKSKQRLLGFLLAHELITREDTLVLGV
jgi:hypothetical protein